MPSYFTANRHGYGVRFSPFDPNQMIVATSQFYGLAGGGTLYFLEMTTDGIAIKEKQQFQWKDGLFDVVIFKWYIIDILAIYSLHFQ
jgi:peroxin-7